MASIQEFIYRYMSVSDLESVTFCGGEVCTLPWFAQLVNWATKQHLLVQIITNGTINILNDIENPNNVVWIVSLDGLPEFHDANRGSGTFQTSLAILIDAQKRGFHTEVFSIVVKQNIAAIDIFEQYLAKHLPLPIHVTYHPRKPLSYLVNHPVSSLIGQTDGFDFLDDTQMKKLLADRKTFPPRELGCFQISLMSDGRVYGCCEGISPVGRMEEPISVLLERLYNRIVLWERMNNSWGCLGCSQPDFVCGMKSYLFI